MNRVLKLTFSHRDLEEIPSEVFEDSYVKYLSLSHNKIAKITPSFSRLSFLTWLDLSNNMLTNFPSELLQCDHLEVLDLSNNEISGFPADISNLQRLKTLNLKNNNIKIVPKEIIYLPNLTNLNLSDNPIQIPPIEVVNQGVKSIRNFYLEFDNEETEYLNELKLLLVGEGRVGKTSIAKSICIPSYNLIDEKSTEGIEIDSWTIKKEELNQEHDFKVNVWDFGGQEIYHSTHQFFLTKRSIYLLITESRKEDKHEDFYYWLNTIKILGDNSPVIVVLNKCDLPTKEIPIEEYKSIFNNITTLEKVSCKPEYKDRIDALKAEIKRIIQNSQLLPHLGTPLPRAWVKIRQKIEKLANQGRISISLQEYLSICEEYNRDEKSAMFLSRFFHDLGVFLHFQDDIELREILFLNHEWVTDSVYKILDNREVKKNYGLFTDKDLIKIWKTSKYNNRRRELLHLMKNDKFEICYQIEQGRYLAPQLLRVDKVDFDWENNRKDIVLVYDFKFMPKGIISRFIVKRNKDIYSNVCWRYGVLLKYKKSKSIIIEKYFERKIEIRVQGENNKELIAIIKKSFQEIFDDFSNLAIEEMIPCACDLCTQSDSPHFYNVSNLNLRYQKGKETIECYTSFENVYVYNLLNNSGYFDEEEKTNNEITIFDGDTLKNVETLIAKDKLSDALNVIFKFSKRHRVRDKEKEVILLQRRLSDVNSDARTGILSRNDELLELNSIANSIIDILYK